MLAVAPGWEWKLALAAPLVALPVAWFAIAGAQLWVTWFLAACVLLPPLPIAWGDSGPHPALVLAALGLVAGTVRYRDWEWSFEAVTGSLAGFFAVLLASVAFSAMFSGSAIAAGSLARVLLFGTGCYVYLYSVHGPPDRGDPFQRARLLFAAAIAAAGFACVDFYYQFPAPAGYSPQFVWLDSGIFRRAQGLFYEASTLGNFCAFFLVMIAVALFRPRHARPCSTVALLGGGVVFTAALIFSYSRGSLLNVVVALSTLAWLRGVRIRRVAAMAAVCATAGAAAVYAVFPLFAQSYWIRLAASVQYFWSAPEGVLSGRLSNWETLARFVAAHPWYALSGIGYKTLPYTDSTGRPVIADNMYLSLLVETGVAGLAVFLFLNACILRKAFEASRRNTPAAAFFGAWIFCFWVGQLVQMLTGDLMTYWRVLPLYFWVLAVAVRESRRSEP